MGKPIDGSTADDANPSGGTGEPATGGDGTPVVNLDGIEPANDAGSGTGNHSGGTGRKRGRPRKDRSGDGSSSAGSDTASGTGTSSQKRKKAHSATLDVGTISLVCSFVSGFVAARAKEPTLKLDDAEAAQVGEAVANVGKFYDIPVSPVMQAWIALGMTVGSIYAGKIAAIKMRGGNRPSSAEPSETVPNVAPFIRPAVSPVTAAE